MASQKGLTIIELMVVVAIALIILPLGFLIISSGTRAHKHGIDEYQLQLDMRVAAENINKITRYSTVLFTVTEDDFEPGVKPLSAGWNYIGTCPVDGIVAYKYDSANNNHTKTILVQNKNDLVFSLEFKDNYPENDDKLLHFALEGYVPNTQKDIIIQSELQALNSLQVVDRGHEFSPAVALAYRSEPRPVIENSHAAVAMVMDSSGSMDWGMGGEGTGGDSRIVILKKVANSFIEQLEHSSVSLVPFSTTANNPFAFKNVENNKMELLSNINSLNPDGGTNTGDGLRRGYYQLQHFNNNLESYGVADKSILNYMVVLVDGVTTMASARLNVKWIGGYWGYYQGDLVNYIDDDGSDIGTTWYTTRNSGSHRFSGQPESGSYLQYNLRRPVGHGAQLDPYGELYVDLIGSSIKNSTMDIKVFVIGFSAVPGELESVNDIANATGATSSTPGVNYYIATDEAELQAVFDDIGGQILTDLWHVSGP